MEVRLNNIRENQTPNSVLNQLREMGLMDIDESCTCASHGMTYLHSARKPSQVLKPLDLNSDDIFMDLFCGGGDHTVAAGLLGVEGRGGVKLSVGLDVNVRNLAFAQRLSRVALEVKKEHPTETDADALIEKALDMVDSPVSVEKPDNIVFVRLNSIQDRLPLPTDFATKSAFIFVAQYLTHPGDRKRVIKELLRVTRDLVHVASPRYDESSNTRVLRYYEPKMNVGEELLEVADEYGIKVEQKGITSVKGGVVYRIIKKPDNL